MNIETKKSGTNKWGGALIGVIVASAAGAFALTPNREVYEDPTKEIDVRKDKVDVRLHHEGGISRHYNQAEKKRIDEQDYFVRRLSVAFHEGKVFPGGSCVTLNYHFSLGTGQDKLDLSGDVVRAYINTVPEPQKTATLIQLHSAAARIANGDPNMQGPMSFHTNEACGKDTLQAYPEALEKAKAAYTEANSWTNKLKFW